jgi:hypothetical protein
VWSIEEHTKISTCPKSLLNLRADLYWTVLDIIYMFDDDEDGGKWISSETHIMAKVCFQHCIQRRKENHFDWMYIDYNTSASKNAAFANGLKPEFI